MKVRKKMKIIIIVAIVFVLLLLVMFFQYLRINRPYRIANAFLNLVKRGEYEDALKMCDKTIVSSLLDKNGKIIGMHSVWDEGYSYDCYFNDLKDKETPRLGELKWYIYIKEISPRRLMPLDGGYYFVIEGSTIKFIDRKF
ncbi:MAG: hypothetical protein HZA49_10475 [Planctomycetes bacterium]|nr:hypothetical protein [Planctomycetota bacterium]